MAGARFAGTMATGAGAVARAGYGRAHRRLRARRAARPRLTPVKEPPMKHRSLASPLALAIAARGAAPHAQGIPVIDIANLIQTIQQVLNDVTKIENQVAADRRSCRSQLSSINGVRNLGNVFNSPALQNYVPAKAYTVAQRGRHRPATPG